jgi:HSP20 family molecular chaperone IbpA
VARACESDRTKQARACAHAVALYDARGARRFAQATRSGVERWFDGESRTWAAAIDVKRGDKALTVRAYGPGVDPENIKIEVEDGVLTISGEHDERKKQSGKNDLRRERRYGSISRSMRRICRSAPRTRGALASCR